jgi:hypothetical protein
VLTHTPTLRKDDSLARQEAATTMVRSINIPILCCLTAALAFAGGHQHKSTRATDYEGFAHFSENVQRYVKLHDRVEKELPKLQDASSSEAIVAHQRALADKIRHARETARPGGIFTPDAAAAFRHAAQREFEGSKGKNARATIQQGEPLQHIRLEVNELYPKELPYTSVPPTLLLKFPRLPHQVAYRIVGRELILVDVDADLVADVMPDALP